MDLLVLLFVIALIGFATWALITYVAMPPQFKTLLICVAIFGVLILLWQVLGGYFPKIHVGR